MRRFSALVLVAALLAGTAATAADAPSFKRGINLARLHSLPEEDPAVPGAFLWPPFQGPLSRISDAELARLRGAGFDFVRLPVAPAPFLAATEAERRLLVDALYDTVKRLQAAGFGVLVDAHPNHHDLNWSAPKILADAEGEAFQAYAGWLKQLARYLRGLPPEKTALGLMNEPQEECHIDAPNEWTRMQPLLYAAVRDIAPDLALVLTTGCYSDHRALTYLDMSPFDRNTLVDVHYYWPHFFTHQGLPFANRPLRYITGLAYPGTEGGKARTIERTRAFIEARRSAGADTPADAFDAARERIDYYYDDPPPVDRDHAGREFAGMRQWAEGQGIDPARLIVGEFGAARPPEGMPEIPGRYLWLEDVRRAAEDNGIGWALWDYNAGDGYPGFGLVVDNESRRIDPEVIKALGLDPGGLGE